jgi:protein kinase/serine/threonine-protein kinase
VFGSMETVSGSAVELIDATNQHTQWSDQYERDLSDVFAVQSDVALQIARALQANLSPVERERITKRPTENLEAYDLYLKSREFSNSDENAQTAMKLLQRALTLDPRFAVAKATLAYRTFFSGRTEAPITREWLERLRSRTKQRMSILYSRPRISY